MQDTGRSSTFSGRAAVLFGNQVLAAGIGIINGILLARLLGPTAKGDYYLVVLVPTTTMILVQLGLPQAFLFFAARGRTSGMLPKAVALTVALSLIGFLAVVAILPLLRQAVLHEIGLGQVLFAFVALPLALNATFTTAVVQGRQAVRWFATSSINAISTTALIVLVIGVLDLSLDGAIAIFLMSTAIQTIGFAIGARRVTVAAKAEAGSVSYRELLRYGLSTYPGTLTQYFSYRVDAYLIAFLITDPSAPLGYYSMAVGLAEMAFFFPNAISALFFPHVAESRREDSDRQVALVSRVTLLVTGVVALLTVPAAIALIWILLPAFVPAIVPFIVLLPGVVALSVTKVVGGYVGGIGMPAVTSQVNVFALLVNIIANFILIPLFGIVGASAASFVSYLASSLVFTAVAARLTNTPVAAFWIPRMDDVHFVLVSSADLFRRLRHARHA